MARRPLGSQLRVQILARDEYRCRMCGRSQNEVPLEVDHVVPVAEGGTDELHNLATLCRDCNRGKSAYRFADYRQMSVVPSNLASHVRFFHDDPTGDFERFHCYVYFKHGVHAGETDDKYHHTWKLSRTQLHGSADSNALVERRAEEEKLKFLLGIRTQLIGAGQATCRN